MRRTTLWLAVLLSLLASAWFPAWSGEALKLPALPQIDADSLPASIRDKFKKAYAAALASPFDASANGRLGMVLQAFSKSDKRAEICYRRARLLDPASFRWAYYLGLVQAAQGRYHEAAATLREALRLDPESFPAQLELGECLLASGDAEEARKLYEGFVARHPDSAEAYYGLARAQEVGRDLPGAIDSFRKACALFPYFGAAHYGLARAYQRLGKADVAREELALYEKSKYDIPGIGDWLKAELDEIYTDPESLLGLGIELGNQGRLREAVLRHEEALRFEPELLRAHVNLISLYGRLHEFEKAEQHYREAVRLSPNRPEIYYNHGVLLVMEGREGEAEEAFQKVLMIEPRHAEAHNNLGDVLQRQGKLNEATAEFRNAIEIKPDFPQAHFNLGRILMNQERYREGIEELLKTLSTEDPDSKPSYVYALAVAYVRDGDRENGLKYMRMAQEQATARQQSKLLESITRDLRTLDGQTGPN